MKWVVRSAILMVIGWVIFCIPIMIVGGQPTTISIIFIFIGFGVIVIALFALSISIYRHLKLFWKIIYFTALTAALLLMFSYKDDGSFSIPLEGVIPLSVAYIVLIVKMVFKEQNEDEYEVCKADRKAEKARKIPVVPTVRDLPEEQKRYLFGGKCPSCGSQLTPANREVKVVFGTPAQYRIVHICLKCKWPGKARSGNW